MPMADSGANGNANADGEAETNSGWGCSEAVAGTDESSQQQAVVPVDIYPYSQSISELENSGRYRDIKLIHMIRHAEGTHNVNQDYRNIVNLDARLTPNGKQQCKVLAEAILEEKKSSTSFDTDTILTDGRSRSPYVELLRNTELVVTSPLTRCIETAIGCFPTLLNDDGKNVPCIAIESIRETVNYACDRRRNTSEIAKDFSSYNIDFHSVSEKDEIWDAYVRRLGNSEQYPSHRESAELFVVANRARDFFFWLKDRPERQIVVCSHSAFLRCLWNWGQPGHVPQLPPQNLDTRDLDVAAKNIPIVRFCGDDTNFENFMRSNYENCELRSFLVAFS